MIGSAWGLFWKRTRQHLDQGNVHSLEEVNIITARMTSQELLIPRTAIREWLGQEIEIIKDREHIIIRPRTTPRTERERVLQVLEAAGLLLPPEPLPPSHSPVSPEEQVELARKFSVGQSLSEIVLQDRADRA